MTKSGPPQITQAKQVIARVYKGNRVIGAGFLVQGGYVLTCAHVIQQSLALKPEENPQGKIVKINFPYISLNRKFEAEVFLYKLHKEEEEINQDIAGLRVLNSESLNVLPANLSQDWLKKSYLVVGFPKGHAKGIASSGRVLADLPYGWVQLEDVKEQGLAIQPGFSGAPVWDEATDTVMGMVVARETKHEAAKIGFMISATTLRVERQELERLHLQALLQDHQEALADAVRVAYPLCRPEIGEIPATLSEIIQTLQDTKRGSSAFEPLDRFIAFLSLEDLNTNPDLCQKILAVLQNRVPQAEQLLKEVNSQRQQQQKEQEQDVESHLLIYLKQEATQEQLCSVTALFVRDVNQYSFQTGKGCDRIQAPANFDEQVNIEDLPKLLQDCLKETLDQSPTNLTLHLILPLTWLHQPCDRWSLIDCSNPRFSFLPKVRVGTRFCCVVRIAERLEPEILQLFQKPWQDKWQLLTTLKLNQVCDAFVLGDTLSPDALSAALNQPKHAGLKLSTGCPETLNPQIFGSLIATGTPAALWLRHNQFSDTIVPVDELNNLLRCQITDLPEVVKQSRSDAPGKGDNDHIGHHLSFLWEDPNLIPPSTQTTLEMPQS